ncbi:MAG: hypothetical protein Q8L86_01995 [Vicinamibacterales bacterium]|nr:hypothetical protein [Vicinamibacterales bacterium]
MRDLGLGVGAAVWAAVAMTAGDWIWATLALEHRPQYGLAHGTLLCVWMGGYFGLVAGRIAMGKLLGGLVGLLAAASFYVLAPVFGYSAMFLSWVGLWFGLAAVVQYLSGGAITARPALVRAGLAATGSGVAFYAVSGIWMHPAAEVNYLWHFAAWTIAFAPGCLALLGRGRGGRGLAP